MISGIDEGSIRELADFRNAEWNGHFKCTHIKVAGHTVSVYKGGKFMLFGVKDMEEAERVMDGVMDMFDSIGMRPEVLYMRITRVSMNGSIGHQVNLRKAAQAIG